ncbi:MAG: hypothetical protein WA918_06705, partial [Erythrobacter sp.]
MMAIASPALADVFVPAACAKVSTEERGDRFNFETALVGELNSADLVFQYSRHGARSIFQLGLPDSQLALDVFNTRSKFYGEYAGYEVRVHIS